jgi:hypothetical protein
MAGMILPIAGHGLKANDFIILSAGSDALSKPLSKFLQDSTDSGSGYFGQTVTHQLL